MDAELSDDVQAALSEFQAYLADQLAPLMVSEAMQTLISQPPQLLMRQIHAWAVEQSRVQAVAMCDLLFHALKKIYLFANLKLVESAAIDEYLLKITPYAMQACPAPDREVLRTNIDAMRTSRSVTAVPTQILRSDTQSRVPKTREAPITDDISRSARRLSLVIERLSRSIPAVPQAAAPAGEDGPPTTSVGHAPAGQLLTLAAASSNSEEDLALYMDNIRRYAGDVKPENIMRALAGAVPHWELSAPPPAGTKPPAAIDAMHKVISLTKNAMESTKRYRDLLMEAVEQFNGGSLSVAVSMLEVASVVVTEKKLDPSMVDRIQGDAVEAISAEQLKKYAEDKNKHPLLRKALGSFRNLTTGSLLEQLRGEERPERRRTLLGLLEAWGGEAREAGLDELEVELNRNPGEIDTYYLRNVLYLLHRIPRETEERVDKELDLLTRATARGQSIYVIKEAVVPAGQLKSEGAVKLLITRLAEFEALLVRNDTSLYPADEMQKLLDKIATALGRAGTPAALLAIARHGMKPNPQLGDTRARLTNLSQYDLSFDEQTVDLIIKTIREDLPNKLLGRLLPKRQPPPIRLIEALSGTRSEIVEKLFEEIAGKFPDQEVGRAAAAALTKVTTPAKPATTTRDISTAVSLSGDLQFFGLPSIVQSLTDQQASGILTLSARQGGQTAGKVLFREGKFLDAQAAHLRGVDALYQLLERPTVGTFSFVPQVPSGIRSSSDPADTMPLLFEGIRRHDELKQASAIVPDDLPLKPTGVKPAPDPDESDPALMRDVWIKVSTAAPIRQWEGQIAADAYRIRRLVARWVEEGALQPQ